MNPQSIPSSMGSDARMYRTTFRILETEDEHFYALERFNYHRPLHGFGLPNALLQKVYEANARLSARVTLPDGGSLRRSPRLSGRGHPAELEALRLGVGSHRG